MIAGENISKPRPFWQHIAIGISLLGLAGVLSRFDVAIIAAADPAEWPGDLKRMFSLSELFAHSFGIALIVFGIWILAPAKRRFIPRLIACAGFSSVAAQLLKLGVARNRPTTFLDEQLVPHWPASADPTWLGAGSEVAWNVQYATQSFPSAHTALVCGLAIGLSYIFPHGKKLFVVIAIIAALQRIIFFAHWPSDVAVGAALGFLIAGGLVQNWGIGGLCGTFEKNANQSDMLIELPEGTVVQKTKRAA
jgi:membrane-associated phospholipid phosphatase